MNVVLRQRMTIHEFLAWEERQELKHEFNGFAPVAMAGGTRNHARLQANLAISLGGRLRGSPCEFLGSDMKIVMSRTVRYPDGQIICTRGTGRDTWTKAPIILFEVLSDSTQSADRLEKNREYRQVESVQRYVILEQDRVAATVHVRAGENWITQLLFSGDTLALPDVGLSLPLAELYETVDLTGPDAAGPEQ